MAEKHRIPQMLSVSGDAVALVPVDGPTQEKTTSGSNQTITPTPTTVAVRLACTEACYYSVRPSADATSAAQRTLLPAGAIEYVPIMSGDIIAVAQVSAAGSFNVKEIQAPVATVKGG